MLKSESFSFIERTHWTLSVWVSGMSFNSGKFSCFILLPLTATFTSCLILYTHLRNYLQFPCWLLFTFPCLCTGLVCLPQMPFSVQQTPVLWASWAELNSPSVPEHLLYTSSFPVTSHQIINSVRANLISIPGFSAPST